MYLHLARLPRTTFRYQALRRNYATRRVLKESPSAPLAGSTSYFQPTKKSQSQPALAEVSRSEQGFEHGVYRDPIHSPNPVFPPSTTPRLPPRSVSAEQDTAAQENIVVAKQNEKQITPLYHYGSKFDREPYWQKIERWKDVTEKEFLSHSWQVARNIQGSVKLFNFLNEVLPEEMPTSEEYQHLRTRDAFIQDVVEGIKEAPMSIRLTPHILSVINWKNPLEDPLRRQFIPMKSTSLPNHPKADLDSLHETHDSPVPGLVHRYPDKVLFLATSVCGLYCRFCTRSYAVGGNTETVTKNSQKPIQSRWDVALDYIASNEAVQDVVVSGGDSYYLLPHQLRYIGDRLLDIPHVRRFRIATKGLCVSPSRSLDPEDTWTDELIWLSNRGKERGKQVAIHTHFNHEQEWSWVTREAAQKLFQNGVMVRNQSVLLRGVNDNVDTMSRLIRTLADNNIQPYYVYQSDMVKGVEDLRTPLSTILSLEREIRGSIAGFMMPSFVVDLPGGGGKRLAASYESYDPGTGLSRFVAPAVKGTGSIEGEKSGRIYEYWDPLAFTKQQTMAGQVEKADGQQQLRSDGHSLNFGQQASAGGG